MHMAVTLVRLGDQRFFIARGTCNLDAISRTNPSLLIRRYLSDVRPCPDRSVGWDDRRLLARTRPTGVGIRSPGWLPAAARHGMTRLASQSRQLLATAHTPARRPDRPGGEAPEQALLPGQASSWVPS